MTKERGDVVLAGAVGMWRLCWEEGGVVGLVPTSRDALCPSEAPAVQEDASALPPWLREGWKRFWQGQDPLVPLVGVVPPFFGQVYDLVRRIPAGEVRTYRQVGEALGCAGGARAVGQAMRKNPWALFVPCHRVVRSDGGLGGYGGPAGIPLKRALLRYEGVGALPGGRFLEQGE